MNIYIAGKITGLSEAEVELKFMKSEAIIRKLGHVPVNPSKIVPWHASHSEAMRICIPVLMTCDAIYLQPDWEASTGAKLERDIASSMDISVIFESKLLQADPRAFQEIRARYSPYKSEILDLLLNVVSEVTKVKKEDITSKERGTRSVSDARHLFIKTAYPMKFTLDKLALYLGGRDTSTILASVTKAEDIMKYDARLKEEYQEIKRLLKKALEAEGLKDAA
jgi:hypothetical protein